jgi:hypothetical protein
MKTERWWEDAARSVGQYERIEGEWRRVNVTPVDVAWLWSQVCQAALCEMAWCEVALCEVALGEVAQRCPTAWEELCAGWGVASEMREERWGVQGEAGDEE